MCCTALNGSSRERGETQGARAPGWYEDPEATDLLRWWDGTDWSDTEFRAKPEDSELVAYVKSYQDLSPRSPTNFLAISSLVQATIALVVAVALSALSTSLSSAAATLVASTLLVLAELVVVLVGLWAAALGVLAIQNARRHQGRRIRHAIAAVLIATAAVIVSVVLFVQQFPAWLDGAGIVG